MKFVELEQGSQEWLQYRNTKIGASDAPVIMGLSPWCTPYQLFLKKLRGTQDPENEAMKRGKMLESVARELAEQELGELFSPKVIENDAFPWACASLDGLSLCGTIAIEIKCPGMKDHELAMQGKIPDKYYPQLQHQMMVGGFKNLLYISYNSDLIYTVNVERDDDYIQNYLIPAEERFWKHLESLEAPPMTERDIQERMDDEWQQATLQYIEAKRNLSYWEEKEKKAKEQLYSLSGETGAQGFGVKVAKCFRKGNVDYTAIPEIKKINIEQYRKPSSEYFKITEIGNK